MNVITLLDTAKAILENPIETLDAKHPNFTQHRTNMKMLAYMGIVPIVDNEFLIQKDLLKDFIKNKGKTKNEVMSEKILFISQITLAVSILTLIVSIA